MSTKTLRKRIALATVAALGAGVLSLVTTTTANAATPTYSTGAPTQGTMSLGSTNATDGLTSVADTNTSVMKSIGVIAKSGSGLAQTATMLSNGILALSYTPGNASSNTTGGIFVNGGTIKAYVVSAPETATVTNLNYISISDSGTIGITVVPNSGVSTMTISAYRGVGANATDYSAGTLEAQAVVSVTTTNSSNVVSLSKSGVYYTGAVAVPATYTPAGGSATIVDTTTAGTGTSDFNTAQYGVILVRDAYGNAMAPSSTSPLVLTAAATNGAYVGLSSTGTTYDQVAPTGPSLSYSSTSLTTGAATSGNATVAITSGSTAKVWALKVTNPTSAPISTTVTISANGNVIGVKTFTFTGKVAKVVLSSPTNGKKSSTGGVTVAYLDAAGNDLTTSMSNTTVYTNSVIQDANTSGNGITVNGTLVIPVGGTYYNQMLVNCPSTNATGSIAVDYTNPLDGSVVVSNTVPMSCSGGADTYSAALDKSTYKPGEIATLKVTFKDSKGALAADYAAGVSGGIASTSTNIPNVLGANLSPISTGTAAGTTAGKATDVTTNGVATYQFIVANASGVDGDYQLSVGFPYVDALGDSKPVTVPYTIASGSTSLNDVLKGIVSLIASINKQIAALAKLVAKK
jgi:trimeric autotransporter adhesin